MSKITDYELYKRIEPYIVDMVATGVTGGGASGAMVAHALNGTYHTGTLAENQAPWVATNINEAIQLHNADANAHGDGYMATHDIISSHSVTGSQNQVVGLTATNTLGLLDTTTDAIADAGGILRSPATPGDSLTLGPVIWQDGASSRIASILSSGVMIVGSRTAPIAGVTGADITGNSRIDGDLEITGSINVSVVTGDFIYTGDGTFYTPSVSFQEDTDLGFYRHADNVIGLVAGEDLLALFGPNDSLFYTLNVAGTFTAQNDANFVGEITLTGSTNGINFQDGGSLISSANYVSLNGTSFRISSGGLIIGGGTSPLIDVSGKITNITGGSAAAPGFTYAGDTDTGIYHPGADQIGFATGGVAQLTVSSSGIVSTRYSSNSFGTAAEPAFSWFIDGDTGMYRSAADTVSFAAGGVLQASIDTSSATFQNTLIGGGVQSSTIGSQSTPAFSFSTDPDTGMHRSSTNTLAFSTGGIKQLEVNSTVFTVTPPMDVTGAVDLSSTLDVTGAVDLASTLDVTGATTLDSTLSVAGAATINMPSAGAPIVLNANGQSQTVVGLRADELNKSITAGDGIDGGGALTGNVTLDVDSTVARRNAANTFTGDITIDNSTPALYLANDTTTWEILSGSSTLGFAVDSVDKLIVGGTATSVTNSFAVDTDTLYAHATNKGVGVNIIPNGDAALTVIGDATDDITAIFRAYTSQTADIWQVQNSGGSALWGVDASGNIESLSTAFISGKSGWQISPDGNVEINNLTARGEIRTALFTAEEIAVDSGTHLFTEGGILLNAFTVASGSLNLDIKDPASGHASLFEVGDNLLLKGFAEINFGAGTGSHLYNPALWWFPRMDSSSAGSLVATETWVEVTGITDMTTYYRYTVEYRGGSYATYPANTVVANFHQGDQGIIGIYSDKAFGPYLDVFIPDATPWIVEPRTTVRLGRLDGISYISGEQYGIALGTDLSDSTAPRVIASDQQFSLFNVDLTISNSTGTGVQFALDDDSYFAGFHYDYSEDFINIGKIDAGVLNETYSYIQYSIAPVGSTSTFDMRGHYQFYPLVDDETQAKSGIINTYLPNHYRYISGLQTGFAIGTGGFEQPTNMLKAYYTGSSTWKMAGYVAGAEHWSVSSTGQWTFGDDLVRITQDGIRLAAVNTAIVDRVDQLYWQLSGGEVTGSLSSYKETNGINYIRVFASSDGPNDAVVLIGATSGLYNYSGFAIGASEDNEIGYITAFQPITLVAQGSAPPRPQSGATMYVDASDGDIKVIFDNGTTKTLLTN